MRGRPPRSTRTDTLFPYPTLCRSGDLPDPARRGQQVKVIAGGVLLQDRDNGRVSRDMLKVVTKRAPDAREMDDCMFAWTVAKHVKSNAIVYAKDGATAGIGEIGRASGRERVCPSV